MQLINRMPTSRYFVTMFILATLLFIAFSTIIYNNYTKARSINSWTVYNYELIRQSRLILLDLVDMETGVRGYLLTGNKRFLEPYMESRELLTTHIATLTSYTQNDETVRTQLHAWMKQIDQFKGLLQQQISALQRKGPAALSKTQLNAQKAQMDMIRGSFQDFIGGRLTKLSATLEASQSANKDFKYVLFIGTVLAIGGMSLTTLIILSLLKRSKRAEEEALHQEQRFQTVMIGVNDGLFDFNVETHEIYYSPSYKTMLGYQEDEIENTTQASLKLMHPEDVEPALALRRRYENGEIPSYTNVFRMLHKNGTWVWILSRGVGIRDNNGKIVRLIGTHTNITEHKKREEELTLLNSEMETFTYITSHDLRAPLVNLKGFAGEMNHTVQTVLPIIKASLPHYTPEEQALLQQSFEKDIPEYLNFIEQSVMRMDILTTAVLNLTRIGKREYRMEAIDTQQLIQRCLDTLAFEINQKKIAVVCDTLPVIYSDSVALEQVFSNILDNAVKYLNFTRSGKITITAQQTINEHIISISDNGRGISPDDHEKVFQIFRRARNSQDVRGMGMGMAFVQATMRRLGGSISFTSAVGEGTTFFVKLPKKINVKEPENV